MEPKAALDELTELSSQIEAAAILDDEAGVAASTFADSTRAERFADVVRKLLHAAEEVAGRAPARLRAATSGGSVFVVREGGRTIAATTGRSPTVGLVLYDLRTCLRSLEGDVVEEARAAG
ncbi:MAG: hypothetical protein H0V40_10910 [Actinobacteria bacterium]|nr:hypothetical protein [Actinomycetota bacterium]